MNELKDFIIKNDVLIEYVGSSGEVVIPECVVEIASFAFSGNKNLKKITIPSNVKRVNSYAFDGCSNLVELDIKEEVEYLGRYAFRNCEALEIIHFPNLMSPLSAIETTAFGVERICDEEKEDVYFVGGNMNVQTIYVSTTQKGYQGAMDDLYNGRGSFELVLNCCLNMEELRKKHNVVVHCLDGIYGEPQSKQKTNFEKWRF